MATYVNDLRLKEIATGDEAGTWGTSTNTNLQLIGEALGYGTQDCFASDADATTTVADGATDPARAMYFKVTSSATLTATRTLTIAPNTVSRVMLIENATTGSQSIAISQGSGGNVTIASGQVKMVYLDGAGAGGAVVDAMASLELGTITVANLTATTADINGGTIDGVTIGGSSAGAGTFSGLTVGAATGITLDTAGTNEASWTHTAGTGSSVINVGRNSTWGGDLTIQTDTKNRLNIESSGDISFYEDTGTTPKFFWDASEESLGVGTTSLVGAGSPLVTRGTTTGKGFVSDNGSNAGFIIQYASGLTSIGQDFNAPLAFLTNNTERMRIDSSGNLGLGVVPSAWSWRALQVGSFGGFFATNSAAYASYLGNNAYYNGTNWVYLASSGAVHYELAGGDGAHKWYTAPTGTAGNAITFTQAMTLDASGNLGIGTSSPSSYGGNLVVSGTGSLINARSSSGTSAIGLWEGASSRFFLVSLNGSDGLAFVDGDGSSERMRIDSSGRVSIANTVASSMDGGANNLVIGSGSGTEGMTIYSGTTNSGVIYFADGSSGDDRFRGQIGYDHGNNSLGFRTNASSSSNMTIDSSGNVGIGTSSPDAKLRIQNDNGTVPSLIIRDGGTPAADMVQISSNATGTAFLINSSGNVGIGTSSPTAKLHILADTPVLMNNAAGTSEGKFDYVDSGATLRMHNFFGTGSNITFLTNPNGGAVTERARIDSSGNLLVGTSSTFTTGDDNNGTGGVFIAETGTPLSLKRAGSNGTIVSFFRGAITSPVGSISIDASSTAYNTSSDARLKENIADAEDAGAKVDAIQVRQFDWKADGSHQDYGMIAQELLTVAPEAVSGDPESDDMMGVDYSKLVPMMLKEIQSLRARVHALEGK